MKRVWLQCVLIGLLLASLAWLIAVVLSDSWLYDDPDAELDYQIEKIYRQLTSTQLDAGPIAKVEQEFNVEVRTVDGELAKDITADDFDESDLNRNIVGDYEQSVFLLQFEGGKKLEVQFEEPDYPFFSSAEIGYWLLQLAAMVATIAIAALLVNYRLQQLNSLARDPVFSGAASNDPDPVENAIQALQQARSRIDNLDNERVDALNEHRELLASVAHEFRNPLARLQFANEMAMDKQGEEQIGLLEEANQAAIELDDLVRETLSYSRLSGQEMAQSTEIVSVTDLFRELAAAPYMTSSMVQVSIGYPESDAFVNANRRLLLRALSNLVTNAMRYASANVLLEADTEKGMVVIRVMDDGQGIPAIHHERIFEPFYRVERSRSRETGGFGLGLSIVKSIVEKHHGTVTVTSPSTINSGEASQASPADGTCFTIQLPLVEEN